MVEPNWGNVLPIPKGKDFCAFKIEGMFKIAPYSCWLFLLEPALPSFLESPRRAMV